MSTCTGCAKNIKRTDKVLWCKGDGCGPFHLSCSGLDKEEIKNLPNPDKVTDRYCRECQETVITANNSESKIPDLSTDAESKPDNAALLLQIQTLANSLNSFQIDCMEKLKENGSKMDGISKEISNINTTLKDHNTRLSKVETTSASLSKTVVDLKETVKQQAATIAKLEQGSFKNDIVIFGIPPTEKGDPATIVGNIYKAVTKSKLEPKLDYCFHLKRANEADNLTIIASFLDYGNKLELMKLKNKLGDLTVQLITKAYKMDNCFIHDRLSKTVQQQYNALRAEVKAGNLAAVKVQKGQLLVKTSKDEKKWQHR